MTQLSATQKYIRSLLPHLMKQCEQYYKTDHKYESEVKNKNKNKTKLSDAINLFLAPDRVIECSLPVLMDS
jgi:hypothetical protein